MRPASPPTFGVVLANLGTPDAATAPAVRRFLREFLSDRRVIEIPPVVWKLILNLFILPFRPRRVAQLYASIWEKTGDSPMRQILQEQVAAVAQSLQGVVPARVLVRAAMS